MATYDECAAFCLELLQMPRELRRTYASADDAPAVALDCWNFPANRFGGGLLQFVHLEGWESRVVAVLTLEGESMAVMHLMKRERIPPFDNV